MQKFKIGDIIKDIKKLNDVDNLHGIIVDYEVHNHYKKPIYKIKWFAEFVEYDCIDTLFAEEMEKIS
jgi:hypothetical protein